ncbi:hypothetical protein ANO11243_063770 [Dothideomycetidae sp. 11243]|nr:hypothetical protein ANO11243_063770 [fungal sp. No.11243]
MDDLVGSRLTQSAQPPKGILKKTSQHPAPAVPPNVDIAMPTTDEAAKHLQTALTYAKQIQAQKTYQLEILGRIEDLSLLPSASPTPASDVQFFKSSVVLFQPSDYQALLQERNVNGFCGYTLCGNEPPKALAHRHEWLRPEAKRRFCSVECARKAMYVKAQLNEMPAWERRGDVGAEILLQDEKKRAAEQEQEQLALERTDQAHSRRMQLVTDDVVEKQTSNTPASKRDDFDMTDLPHDSIEGYNVPSGKYRSTKINTDKDHSSTP